jgi:chromatin segregation and condensation protein Rec8/ScpA/Scc1 (kleisin family)
VAGWLEQAAARRAERLPRGYLPPPPDIPPPPLTVDLVQLLEAVEKVIAAIPSPVLHRVVPRPLDTEGALRRLEALLAEREEFGWRELLGERPTIVEILSSLLAVLELARRGALRLVQSESFGSVLIHRSTPIDDLPLTSPAPEPTNEAADPAH